MTSAKIITKNVGWLFASNIISNIIGFVLIVLIARFLGDENLGAYSFAFAFTSIFAVFFDLGILQFSVREIAIEKSKTERYYWNVATIKFFLGIIALILPITILFFYGATALTLKVVAIASIAMFFNYYAQVFKMLFQAYEIMEYDALSSIIERLFALAIGALVLFLGYSLFTFVFVLSLSYFIYFVVSYILASKKVCRLSFKIDFTFWKFIVKNSLPFWLSMLFLKIYFQIDTVMLSAMQNYAVTGWYNAAYSLVNGLFFIPFVIVTVTFPAMSILYIKNKMQLKILYNKCFSYLFMIGFPIAVGTLFLSKRIILFLYKEQFINSSFALQILIWAELFVFLNYFMGYLLNSIDKQKLFTYSTGICVIINIILNFILIPKFSYIGASFATVITVIANFTILFYFTSRSGYKLKIFNLIKKPVLAASAMAVFVYFFSWVHILIIIPLAALIYFLILFLLRAVGKGELDLIKSLFQKNR